MWPLRTCCHNHELGPTCPNIPGAAFEVFLRGQNRLRGKSRKRKIKHSSFQMTGEKKINHPICHSKQAETPTAGRVAQKWTLHAIRVKTLGLLHTYNFGQIISFFLLSDQMSCGSKGIYLAGQLRGLNMNVCSTWPGTRMHSILVPVIAMKSLDHFWMCSILILKWRCGGSLWLFILGIYYLLPLRHWLWRRARL